MQWSGLTTDRGKPAQVSPAGTANRPRRVRRYWSVTLVAGVIAAVACLLAPPQVSSLQASADTVHLNTAGGVRLHNRDGKAYRLYVRHASSAVHTSIGPRTVTNICSGQCNIKLKDNGTSIAAKPGDVVTIAGGKLVRK